MAKVKETRLTFSVTIPQPKGLTIPATRAMIVESIRETWPTVTDAELDDIRCHLLNKEVHYG